MWEYCDKGTGCGSTGCGNAVIRVLDVGVL